MILECAECHTRYQIADDAIGPEGRTVRCANCKYSWFQVPPLVRDLTAPPPPEPESRAEESAPMPAPPPAADRATDAAPPPPVRTFVDDAVEPGATGAPVQRRARTGTDPQTETDTGASPRAPRNRARLWTIVAVLAGLALLVATAALLYADMPGLASRVGVPASDAQNTLQFSGIKVDRGRLASGSELFAVSGQINNPGSDTQRVPDIRAELVDASGKKVVYRWTITPPRRALGPGQSMGFNSAKLDVPDASKSLGLSFAGDASE